MASPATHTADTIQFSASDVDDLTQTSHFTNSSLMSLPREIRDEICAYLLNAGDLSILRTSKHLSHEAKERLYREGVYRVKLGGESGGDVGSFLPKELGRIHNYEIRAYFGPGCYLDIRHFFRDFKHFAGHGETHSRRECYVIIEYDPSGRALWMNDSKALAAAIACLAIFKKVVMVPLRVECKRKKLRPELGPSRVIGDTHGGDEEWMFQPVKFRSSRVHKFESKLGAVDGGLCCVQ